MIQGLLSKHLDKVWHEVWSVLAPAFAYSDGAYDEQLVYNGLKTRNMQLWLEVEDEKIISAGVTKIIEWPDKKVCWAVGLAGKGDDLVQRYLETVEPWARHHGCAEMRLTGRRGWERKMKRLGFEFRHVEMAKQLGD